MSRRNIGMAQLRLEYAISIALFSLSIKAAENSAKDESVGENMLPSLQNLQRLSKEQEGRIVSFNIHS